MRWLVILCGLALFYSHTFADSFFFGGEGTGWTDHVNDKAVYNEDFSMTLEGGIPVGKNLYLNADVFSYHMISDRSDTSHFDHRVSGINSFVSFAFLPFVVLRGEGRHDDDILMNSFFWTLFLLNPTVEYFFWKGWVPVSVSAGYKMDWFAFSPGRKFYFRPHADLNINFMVLRVSASYAYVVTNTYELKRGPRFYLKVYLGWVDRDSSDSKF